MTVRFKLALTIFSTGLVTLLLVMATVLYAFQRFEHETAFRRGTAFLQRVVATHVDLFDLYMRRPGDFSGWLRNLVLFEPDTELYLLGLDGRVLARSGKVVLPAGFRVALGPVRQVLLHPDMPYVMGDDPERMDADAVIAVQPVHRAAPFAPPPGRADTNAGTEALAAYLYLVLHTQQLPEGRWDALRSSFARPVLWLIFAVVAFTTGSSVLVIAAVTKPLRRLTHAVSRLSERGIEESLAAAPEGARAPEADLPPAAQDEFGQLTRAFEMMLVTLRRQWAALRRLDHFRREGVSNLSHDLRSPLTATVACLETLEARWAHGAAPPPPGDAERRLVEVALRNTRNAARLVRSLGDLAQLDEPEFKLRVETVDVGELLDDICLRFAGRAAQLGISVHAVHGDATQGALPFAALDIELFERAIANLVDNALKFSAAPGSVALGASVLGGRVRVDVIDTGRGIAADELPHLFDRFYQSRQSVAPATGQGGKGLGLAIVKRIVELHGGEIGVTSVVGRGTTVVLWLPFAAH